MPKDPSIRPSPTCLGSHLAPALGIHPRGMLATAFGLDVPDGVEIRVHDSTSDVRWMVIPQRPAGTEGLSEEELAELVTPESLVGTALAGQLPHSDEAVARGLDGVMP